ncbi:hypothetical protein ROS9278_03049 [Roseomonas sp. CECT 9278]|nr:hypothetical protein ROS9278_03049 [Roseomonas sp. CECT 9278]
MAVARDTVIRGFLLCAVLAAPALAQSPLEPWLVQSACLDAAGRMVPGRLPIDAGCARRVAQQQADPMPYRRHDWPAVEHAAAQPQGYQASDAVLGTLMGRPAAIHTFDFGAGEGRRFGAFDSGRGDGGQVVPLTPGPAYIAMTEDGGGGVQWFLSPDCRQGGLGWQGWLVAAPQPGAGWSERVVRLRIAPTAAACPTRFDDSLTRWRRTPLDLPWRDAATGRQGSARVDAIVSEHYGGGAIATADHLERFVLARDLGMVRWERWENTARSRRPNLARDAATFARQQRCPPLALSEAPDAGWLMTDCRTWTNFVRAAPGRPLRAMAWPPPALR